MPPDPDVERLVAGMLHDKTVLGQLAERLADARTTAPWSAEDPIIYLVAVTLDHYYSAFESLAERVVRAFEGPPDRGERWHKELLEGVSFDIRGVRPPLISAATRSRLAGLLEFRHFMRHAYGVPLDPDRLRRLDDLLQEVHPMVTAEVEAFISELRG